MVRAAHKAHAVSVRVVRCCSSWTDQALQVCPRLYVHVSVVNRGCHLDKNVTLECLQQLPKQRLETVRSERVGAARVSCRTGDGF